MIEVSAATKAAFIADGIHKEYRVTFPKYSLDIDNTEIISESIEVSECIMDSSNIECVGCIASSLHIQIANLHRKIMKGAEINVYVTAGETEEIQLFHGYVDSAKKDANRKIKTIEAYDPLYKFSDKDVTDWFNALNQDMEIAQLLSALCTHLELQLDKSVYEMVNANMVVHCGGEANNASDLSAISLLKAICQINGCFGYMTRNGKFSWTYLEIESYDDEGRLYPSNSLYPSNDLYPGLDESKSIEARKPYIDAYSEITYEDFQVKPVDSVTIRRSSDDEGYTFGDGKNKYIVQGNLLCEGWDEHKYLQAAENIYNCVSNVFFTPFSSTNLALPYIQCGDEIFYDDLTANPDTGKRIHFFIFNRTMKGGQHFLDSYEAIGDEEQHEFLSDLGMSLKDLQDELEDNYYDKDETDEAISQAAGLYSIVSVSRAPENPEAHTLYCIRGEVTVVQTYDEPYSDEDTSEDSGEEEPDLDEDIESV